MERANYKTEIIFTNVLLCLLVVFVHVSSHPVSHLQKNSYAYILVMFPWRLSAFAVQGFIFLASLKIFIKEEITDYKKYYITRFKKIVLPYLLWVLIYYLYFFKIGYFPFSIKDLGMYVIIGNIVSPFYFIIIIIQFYALMPFWQKIYRNSNPTAAVVVSLLITILFKNHSVQIMSVVTGGTGFFYTDRVFLTYLIFWTLGSVCGLSYNKFKEMLKRNLVPIIIAFVAIACLDLFFTYKVFVLNESIPLLETLHMFYCIVAIMAVMGIGLYVKENKILLRLNPITFHVFLSHCFVMLIVDRKMASLGIFSIAKSYIIRFISVYVITITFCLIYNKIRNSLPKKISMIK